MCDQSDKVYFNMAIRHLKKTLSDSTELVKCMLKDEQIV